MNQRKGRDSKLEAEKSGVCFLRAPPRERVVWTASPASVNAGFNSLNRMPCKFHVPSVVLARVVCLPALVFLPLVGHPLG